jgi:adenylylsulfate kinase
MNGTEGFAVWITGIPASGKSAITRELVTRLNSQGLSTAVLESDALRKVLTPEPTFGSNERDHFYLQMAQLGAMLTRQGIPVIFDATANRRSYRDHARTLIPRFVEVFVSCTLDICRERDPKGLYAAAARGAASNVPGMQAVYEPPLAPEVTVDCREIPPISAEKIFTRIMDLHYI